MNRTRMSRIGIASGAAVLCFGVTAPALAHGTVGTAGTDSAATHPLPEPTLAQEQAWIDSFVSHRTAWLNHLAAAARADTYLTAAQRVAALASVGKAETALQQFKASVDAATSKAQLRQLVASALASLPRPRWPQPLAHPGDAARRTGKHTRSVAARKAMRRQARNAALTDMREATHSAAARDSAEPDAGWGRHCDHPGAASPTSVAVRVASYRYAARAGDSRVAERAGERYWGDGGDRGGRGDWGRHWHQHGWG